MKSISLFFLFMIFMIQLHAQNNAEIKGRVFDSKLNPLEKATVSLVSQEDSLVISYALTDAKGGFDLVRVPTQKPLILYVSHVNSSPFGKKFQLKPAEKLTLDSIIMRENSIEEVLITAVAPIRLNGDTLEYKADYFKTRPNASVEELLKLLPGLQVNMDGSIFYQGREVSGVRVNNKDFFTQDLTIATRNLDASLIDVVQVIKDKGESKREVLDDRDLPIVLNLKMKKEFLKADFGKLYGGAATRDRYESGALLNAFRDTLQVSFIGYGNNIGRSGFDYSELSQYGGYGRGENNNYVMYGSNGLMDQISTGLNINYDIAKKLKTNLLYNYKQFNYYNEGNNQSNSIYNEIQELSKGENHGERTNHQHEIRAFARYHIDTTSQVSFDGRLERRLGQGTQVGNAQSWRDGNIPVTDQNHSSNSSNSGLNYRQTVYAEKKFQNKWLLSLRHTLSNNDNESDNQSFSLRRFYLNNDSLFDQENLENSNTVNFNMSHLLNLQIPISKKVNFDLYSEHKFDQDKATEGILNRLNSDEFVNRSDLANDKGLSIQQTSFGTRWKINPIKDLSITAGLRWLTLENHFDYYQKLENIRNQQDYWLPDFSIGYKGGSLRYSRNVSGPSFYQIQVVDSDLYPNHLSYASPYFENVTSNNYGVQFNKYFNKSKISFSVYGNYTKMDNSIGYERTYDLQNSFSTSRNFQTGPSQNSYVSGNFSKTFVQNKIWKLSYSFRMYLNSNQNYNRVNQEDNLSTSYYGNMSNSINLSYKDLWSFSPNYGVSIRETNFEKESVNFRNLKTNEHNLGASLHFYNIKKFKLETSYTLKNQVVSLDNKRQNLHLINASIYYPVFGKGELKLSVFDLLNQNISNHFYSHQNTTTYLNQVSLRQYFMFGMVYKFLNTGKK